MQNPVRNERFAITLNIGLGNNPLGNHSLDERIKAYAEAIATAFTRAHAPVRDHSNVLVSVAQSDTELTDCLAFDVQPWHGDIQSKVESAVKELCGKFNQGAIAVTWSDQSGTPGHTFAGVYGPKADTWGAFDPDKFIPYGKGALDNGAALFPDVEALKA